MKEKFRDWEPKDKMLITYKDPNNLSLKKLVEINGKALLAFIIKTLDEYSEMGLKLTNREIYYQLVATDAIPNATDVYKRLCVFLTDARYAGYLDWDAIEDRSRNVEMHAEWEGIEDLIESAVASYRLKRWENQPYYLEMYCEKEAGEGKLKPVTDKYHIHFGANKGYSSASMMYEMSRRIREQLWNGKKVVIPYFGDHDPSGLDMIRDIKDRLTEFIGKDVDLEEKSLEIVPIALNKEQIEKYKCPPNPAKITDPRAKWYIETYGNVSWELDALKPNVLIELAENAILSYLDIDEYNAIIEREKKEIDALKRFGKRLKKR
jgi:hypothetical protein